MNKNMSWYVQKGEKALKTRDEIYDDSSGFLYFTKYEQSLWTPPPKPISGTGNGRSGKYACMYMYLYNTMSVTEKWGCMLFEAWLPSCLASNIYGQH